MWDELPRVAALVDKIVTVHGRPHPEPVEIAPCFAQVRADLEPNLKEERALFQLVVRLEPERAATV